LLFLSAGEQSLTSLAAEGGKRTHAGQEIRLADIDADAGVGMGIVEELNGHPSAASLVDAIREATSRTYGAVGIEWLSCVVRDRARIAERLGVDLQLMIEDFVPAALLGKHFVLLGGLPWWP